MVTPAAAIDRQLRQGYEAAKVRQAAETRRCAECGEEKPLSEFGKKQGKGTQGGHTFVCKDCGKRHRVEGLRRKRAAPPADTPVPVPTKACTRCERQYPLAEFAPYEGTIDNHDFLCRLCRETATVEREGWKEIDPATGLHRVAVGECARCHQESLFLYTPPDGKKRPICLACYQAAERDKPEPRLCATEGCGQPVHRNARWCETCADRRNKASQAASYQRMKAAAAAGGV